MNLHSNIWRHKSNTYGGHWSKWSNRQNQCYGFIRNFNQNHHFSCNDPIMDTWNKQWTSNFMFAGQPNFSEGFWHKRTNNQTSTMCGDYLLNSSTNLSWIRTPRFSQQPNSNSENQSWSPQANIRVLSH